MNTSPGSIAFQIFNIDIRWYGILMAAGILTAVTVSYLRADKHGLDKEKLMDVFLFSILAGIIGARLYYVIFNWGDYSGDFFSIINTRGGGLSIHGGLIFGMTTGYLLSKLKKLTPMDVLDLCVPGIALAQAIARWGNFFNSEAHGGPTNLPWAIYVAGEKVHPTFLYESIYCLMLFFLLIYLDNRRKFTGQIFYTYVILYSTERFFVEIMRTDSLMLGPLKQAQVLSLLLIVVCGIFYYIKQNKYKAAQKANAKKSKRNSRRSTSNKQRRKRKK